MGIHLPSDLRGEVPAVRPTSFPRAISGRMRAISLAILVLLAGCSMTRPTLNTGSSSEEEAVPTRRSDPAPRRAQSQRPVQPAHDGPFPPPDPVVAEAYKGMLREHRERRIRAIPHEISLLEDEILRLEGLMGCSDEADARLRERIKNIRADITRKRFERHMHMVEQGRAVPLPFGRER